MCVNLLALSQMNGVQAGGNLIAGANMLSAVGSLAAGIGQRGASEAEAKLAEMAGRQRAAAIRRQAGGELGAARAAAVSAGVSVGSGSVMDAERDIVRYSEQDALTAIVTGQGRGAALRARGRQAMANGLIQAGDSLLAGADAWKRTRRRPGFRPDDPYANPLYVGGSENE